MAGLSLSPPAAGSRQPRPFAPLREDIDLYPAAPLIDGSPTWVLHDPVSNRFVQIGWLEFEILTRWQSGDPAAIATAVNSETTLTITEEDVADTGTFLERLQLLQPTVASLTSRHQQIDAGRGGLFTFLIHHYLFFRIPLFHPDRFLSSTLWMVRPLFTRGFLLFVVVCALAGLFLVLRQWDTFVQSSIDLISLDSLLFYVAAVIAAKCVHELGHAFACKLYGLNVPVIGIAFLVLWPFLYTDTGESWKLSSRRRRLVIVSAGMAAECTLAVFSTLAWTVLPPGVLRNTCFFLATTSWVMTLVINISPFMRWDGYYLLSDLTGIKNLQPRSMTLAKWFLRELLFAFGDPPPEENPPGVQRFMIVYAFAVWLYRLTVFLGIAFLVYHFFIKMVGILLMIVELSCFIWLPIQKELAVWYKKRGEMRWNRHSIVTAALFAVLLALFFLPWRNYLLLPAVEKPGAFVEIYPADSGRLVRVAHREGDKIQAQELLYELNSPALDAEIASARLDLERAEALLRQSAAADQLREEREIILEEQTKARSSLDGLLRRQHRQQIVAPWDGTLVEQAKTLRPGLWVAADTRLAIFAGEEKAVIHAYARAEELERLQPGGTGIFYPEERGAEPIAVRVTRVSRVNVGVLKEKILAAPYGGAIEVKPGEQGEMVPVFSLFQVDLVPEKEVQARKIERGFVRISAKGESFAWQVWRNVHALLIRESGF